MHHDAEKAAPGAFTLIELLIAASILIILATIGVPVYQSALRIARISKAVQELRVISQAIDMYRLNNDGQLPLTLAEVGHGGRLDPWGVPYCYFNYSTGTGDGLAWAISSGLVDPAALVVGGAGAAGAGNAGGKGKGGGGGAGGGNGGGGGIGIGIGAQIATVASSLTGPQVAALVQALMGKQISQVFVGVPVEAVRRRDQFLFPLNTDYDLFSLGPDGRSASSLSNPLSLDDVIRANDGGFFGTAASY
jgi:general secretion pathway protein G